ncbi:cell division protein FtsL, partial [Staphylococcus aureus]
MIRPFTCICMLLAAGSGLFLYQAKHQGQMLDRQIEQIGHATDETRARIGVLRAEFALLNDPTRGIDVGTKQEIYRLLRDLADAGTSIVLYSTDYDELIGC